MDFKVGVGKCMMENFFDIRKDGKAWKKTAGKRLARSPEGDMHRVCMDISRFSAMVSRFSRNRR